MQPFENIRVLDLTHVFSGPFCSYQLGVMGADVIKVEAPNRPDMTRLGKVNANGVPLGYVTQNANKRAISLDLKSSRGRIVFEKLVVTADVLVENYRAGVLDALALGYEDLRKLNPRLIYCSVSGFGQLGPKRGHAAFDNVIQAASGLMSVTGTPEVAPLKVGSPVIDYGAGFVAAFAVASALFQRERTGCGQCIDVSMMDTTMMLMASTMVGYLNGAGEPKPMGNRHAFGIATYVAYATKDGQIMLGAYTVEQRVRLWKALGRADEAETALRAGLDGARDIYAAEADVLERIFGNSTADELLTPLHAAAVPAEKISSVAEAATHPQLQSRGVFQKVADAGGPGIDLTLPVTGFSYEHGGPSIRLVPPRQGQHSEEILTELGLDQQDIRELRADGVI